MKRVVHIGSRVVYLGIDGVITTERSYAADRRSYPTEAEREQWRINSEMLWRVGLLCRAANAAVVVSSAWRARRTEEQLRQLLQAGLDDEVLILGTTPILPGGPWSFHRGEEIEADMRARGLTPEQVVVLDDDETVGLMSELRPRWIQTQWKGESAGFTSQHLQHALRLFGMDAFAVPTSSHPFDTDGNACELARLRRDS